MLASLLNPPRTEADWRSWAFSHRQAHDRIRQAVQRRVGTNLAEYVLDPIPFFQLENWLRRNQESHTDFNQVLNLQNSDLSTLDPTNEQEVAVWVSLEYQQLYAAYAALGIS